MQTRDMVYDTPLSCAVAAMAALEACRHACRAHSLVMSPDGAGTEALPQLSPLRLLPILQSGGLTVRLARWIGGSPDAQAALRQLTLGRALAGFHARMQTLPALQRAPALEHAA